MKPPVKHQVKVTFGNQTNSKSFHVQYYYDSLFNDDITRHFEPVLSLIDVPKDYHFKEWEEESIDYKDETIEPDKIHPLTYYIARIKQHKQIWYVTIQASNEIVFKAFALKNFGEFIEIILLAARRQNNALDLQKDWYFKVKKYGHSVPRNNNKIILDFDEFVDNLLIPVHVKPLETSAPFDLFHENARMVYRTVQVFFPLPDGSMQLLSQKFIKYIAHDEAATLDLFLYSDFIKNKLKEEKIPDAVILQAGELISEENANLLSLFVIDIVEYQLQHAPVFDIEEVLFITKEQADDNDKSRKRKETEQEDVLVESGDLLYAKRSKQNFEESLINPKITDSSEKEHIEYSTNNDESLDALNLFAEVSIASQWVFDEFDIQALSSEISEPVVQKELKLVQTEWQLDGLVYKFNTHITLPGSLNKRTTNEKTRFLLSFIFAYEKRKHCIHNVKEKKLIQKKIHSNFKNFKSNHIDYQYVLYVRESMKRYRCLFKAKIDKLDQQLTEKVYTFDFLAFEELEVYSIPEILMLGATVYSQSIDYSVLIISSSFKLQKVPLDNEEGNIVFTLNEIIGFTLDYKDFVLEVPAQNISRISFKVFREKKNADDPNEFTKFQENKKFKFFPISNIDFDRKYVDYVSESTELHFNVRFGFKIKILGVYNYSFKIVKIPLLVDARGNISNYLTQIIELWKPFLWAYISDTSHVHWTKKAKRNYKLVSGNEIYITNPMNKYLDCFSLDEYNLMTGDFLFDEKNHKYMFNYFAYTTVSDDVDLEPEKKLSEKQPNFPISFIYCHQKTQVCVAAFNYDQVLDFLSKTKIEKYAVLGNRKDVIVYSLAAESDCTIWNEKNKLGLLVNIDVSMTDLVYKDLTKKLKRPGAIEIYKPENVNLDDLPVVIELPVDNNEMQRFADLVLLEET